MKDLLIALVFHVFLKKKKGHFFNINGACKAIDVDTRCEVVIKTWKASAKNRSFSISQKPTAQYFFQVKMDIFSRLMVHAKIWMFIQDVKL